MKPSTLRAEALCKQFDTATGMITVLDGIAQTFVQGQTYAITGASGTGKSTLLHILAGLQKPTSGTVYLNEQQIALFDSQQKEAFLNQTIGLLFQLPYLIKELTVLENVMLKGLIVGQNTALCKRQALTLLETIGLPDKAHEKPSVLSGGQEQRVALARALFNKPAFLLADEPTGNLDPKTGQVMVDLLITCQKQWGMGIIVSTHDHYVADRMQIKCELKDGLLHILHRNRLIKNVGQPHTNLSC